MYLSGDQTAQVDESLSANSFWRATKAIRPLLVLALAVIASVFSIIAAGSPELATSQMMLAFAVLTIGFTLGVVTQRYRTWGLGDPVILFASVFAVYNVSVLIEFAISAWSSGDRAIFFIDAYQPLHYFVRAGAASTLAAIGIFASAALLPKWHGLPLSRHQLTPIKRHESAARTFRVGATGLIGYMALTLLIVIMTVGVVGFLSAARAGNARLNPSTALGIGIPLLPLAIAGIACMLVGLFSFPRRQRTIVFFVLMGLFVLFNFVQGNRHLVIYALIMGCGAYFTLVKPNRSALRKLILIVVVAYTLFVFVNGVRSLLPAFFGGNATTDDITQRASNFSATWLLPSRNEFGGPYYTLIDELAFPRESQFGQSYASAILSVLPTKLYPGPKPMTVAAQFAADFWQRIGVLTGVGFGYSPVAEAFFNFGWLGVSAVFAVFTVVFHLVGSLRTRGTLGVLIYLVLLAQTVNMNRYSLDGVMQEAVFSVVVVSILYLLSISRLHANKGTRSISV